MAKGKLSQTEKYAIQGMLQDDKSVEEIEEALGRTGTKVVKNYIGGELDNLINTVVTARIKRAENGDEEVESSTDDALPQTVEDDGERRSERGNKLISSKELITSKLAKQNESKVQPSKAVKVNDKIREETILRLRAVGMEKKKAEEVFNRGEKKLLREPRDAEEMYTFCLRQLNALDHMVTQTDNPRTDEKQVAIMTGSASAIIDNNRERRHTAGQKPKTERGGHIYNPKTGNYR